MWVLISCGLVEEGKMEKRKRTLGMDKSTHYCFVLAGVISQFFFTPIVVDGDSMMPTLKDGIE